MEQKDMVNSKLDSLMQYNKVEYNLQKNMLDMMNNISLKTSKKLDSIAAKLDKVLNIEQKLDLLEEKLEPKTYSGEEIYKLNRQGYSWEKLSKMLNIPKSTLQHHARKYRNGETTYIRRK